MNFLEFRDIFKDFGCFSLNNIRMVLPCFSRINLIRWTERGYIVPLRQSWYMFADDTNHPDMMEFVACKIYQPSYISLHYALSFYGLIPEGVFSCTSVTTSKTNSFENRLGTFRCYHLKPDLFFGYTVLRSDVLNILMATVEKAVLDLLYLFPMYQTEKDMSDLRFDEDIIENEFDCERFNTFLERFKCLALDRRARVFLKTYGL